MGTSIPIEYVGAGLIVAILVTVVYGFATGLARAQRSLQKAYRDADAERERLAVVLRSVPHGVVVLDAEQVVLMANGRASGLWGLSPGEIAGLDVQTLSRRNTLMCGDEAWQLGSLLQDEGNDTDLAPVEVHTAESEMLFEVTGSPVVAPAGDHLGTIILFRDVTAEREVEELRETLIHMMVHDLRTPLGGVHTTIAALRADAGDLEPEVRDSMLSLAARAATKMLGMVETLVDIGRLEAGKMPLERASTDVASLLTAAAEQVRPLADAKEISLEVGQAADGLTVWADPGLVERVLVNVASNGVKFTPRGGKVSVRAWLENGDTVFAVQDTGPGIPPEDRARVFDRFTQTGQRHQWGSGLGLAFCKLVVDAHGGRIWVEGPASGGSVFKLTLPNRD